MTKVCMGDEFLHQIVSAVDYVLEHPEVIQRAVNFCLEQARLCIEKHSEHFEQL